MISSSFTDQAAASIKNMLSAYSVEQINGHWHENSSVQALIIRSKDVVNSNFLSLFPRLELIVSATSGFDHFNLTDLKKSKVKACYSPEANVQSAAEITIFHILSFLKKGPNLLASPRPLERSDKLLGEELREKTVVLIGLGRIGSLVSRILTSGFGCKVYAYDPYLDQQAFIKAQATPVTFEDALKLGDIISLHCPLTKQTKQIINKESLLQMKASTLLVNCARGELIESSALAQALNSGNIKGACLDVFAQEPLEPSSPFLKLSNVTTSPHIGGYTVEAQKKSALEAAQQVKNWFEAERPVLSSVPPAVPWIKDLQ